jgi:hypothetical protein
MDSDGLANRLQARDQAEAFGPGRALGNARRALRPTTTHAGSHR